MITINGKDYDIVKKVKETHKGSRGFTYVYLETAKGDRLVMGIKALKEYIKG